MADLSIGELVFANLVLAVVSLFGLFVLLVVGGAARRPGALTYWLEVGLTVGGPVCAVFCLFWLVLRVHPIFLIGLAFGLAAGVIFLIRQDQQKNVSTGQRSKMVELCFSLGVSGVLLAMVSGLRAFAGAVGRSIDLTTAPHDGKLVRLLLLFVAVGVAVVIFKLFEKDQTRRMQQPKYRKLEEEKLQLERRIAEIEDMQEFWEKRLGGPLPPNVPKA